MNASVGLIVKIATPPAFLEGNCPDQATASLDASSLVAHSGWASEREEVQVHLQNQLELVMGRWRRGSTSF